MKFLRTIRFDSSDEYAFQTAAEPDEWAVSGAFEFAELEEEDLTGKTKQEFANGFLGLGSFGRSTFVTVAEISDDELADLEDALTDHFIEIYGAPSRDIAYEAAREEVGFVVELCHEAPTNTVLAIRRSLNESGEIAEEFRTIKAPSGERPHTRVWSVEE